MARPPTYNRANPALFDNIPSSLRALPRWVCWRVQPRGEGKPAKIPVDARNGRDASVTSSTTWSVLEVALERFRNDINITGIGFVFSAEDHLTGIDIDDCRDPETGIVADWAQTIIDGLDSYSEISPSGTGVKVFIKAVAPGTESRRNKVEIYSTARYFTVTGDMLKPDCEVMRRQEELDNLYQLIFGEVAVPQPVTISTPAEIARKLALVQAMSDEQIITLAMEAANGAKFNRLWHGELIDLGGDHSRADMSLCTLLTYWTRGDAVRVDRLFRRSGLMRPKWNERRGAMTYGARTVSEAVAIISVLYDPDAGATPSRNDLGNADIFIRLAGEDFRWVPGWKMWLSWCGVCWKRDGEGLLKQAAERVTGELMRTSRELFNAGHEDAPRAYKWALQAGEAHRINAMDQVLRWRLTLDAEILDRKPLVLACGNGVLDLRTGEMSEGKRGDWLTRGTGVRYLPRAACPRFEEFLREIMCGDEEMVAYLWRVIGYCLTGDTSERVFFILHGEGRNGKTTLVEVLHALMDRYAQVARFATFLQKQTTGGANDDIAHLAGARVVIASEADEAQALDASTIKTLTGSDSVRARFLYGQEFEFKPNFKLLLVTNHVPRIHEASHALWDRLHFISFNYRVPENKTDRALGLTLLGELEGIMARAVEGCIEWQHAGLRPPASVRQSVADLREDMDPVGEAVGQLTVESTNGHKLRHSALYDAYQGWCRENGIRFPVSSKTLMKRMKGKGHELVVGRANARCWLGIQLREGESNEEEI